MLVRLVPCRGGRARGLRLPDAALGRLSGREVLNASRLTATTDPAGTRHVVLSGCSGGGKSTLLAELSQRGLRTVPEPGRRIVRQETEAGGRALPWVDFEAFARRAVAMARDDRADLADGDWVFFDRGLVDAASALAQATDDPKALTLLQNEPRYHRTVFMAPPWPELFASDAERRHGLVEAVGEYDRLMTLYDALGYETVVLPKTGVDARAAFVLARLG